MAWDDIPEDLASRTAATEAAKVAALPGVLADPQENYQGYDYPATDEGFNEDVVQTVPVAERGRLGTTTLTYQ